jgi:hypothetical protein
MAIAAACVTNMPDRRCWGPRKTLMERRTQINDDSAGNERRGLRIYRQILLYLQKLVPALFCGGAFIESSSARPNDAEKRAADSPFRIS